MTMPTSRPFSVDDADAAEALLRDRTIACDIDACRRDQRQLLAPVHDVADEVELGAEPAAGMEAVEVVGGEAARLEERDGQRVAEGELHQRRGGRGEPVRAGFAGLGQEQDQVGLAGQRALRQRRSSRSA